MCVWQTLRTDATAQFDVSGIYCKFFASIFSCAPVLGRPGGLHQTMLQYPSVFLVVECLKVGPVLWMQFHESQVRLWLQSLTVTAGCCGAS